jgi:hypothetical protein
MSRNITHCANCDEEASGRHSIPVNDQGEVSPITSKEPWSGMPACEVCYKLHQVAGDKGHEVLNVYADSVTELRDELRKKRETIGKIYDLAGDAI